MQEENETIDRAYHKCDCASHVLLFASAMVVIGKIVGKAHSHPVIISIAHARGDQLSDEKSAVETVPL